MIDTESAKTTVVDNVEYIAMDKSSSKNMWKLNYTDGIIADREFVSNRQMNNVYSSLASGVIQLKTTTDLIYGLGNTEVFLPIKFTKNGRDILKMHVPVIISNIGYSQVVYNNASQQSSLEYSLERPEDFIKNHAAYAYEIKAGETTQILYETDGSVQTNAGIYTIHGTTNQLAFYSLLTSELNVQTSQDLIKDINKIS